MAAPTASPAAPSAASMAPPTSTTLAVEGIDGAATLFNLPGQDWQDRWDRIVVDDGVRRRISNAALFSLAARAGTSFVGVPSHGLVLLSGPPGTGKTTLAYGLADKTARTLANRGIAARLRLVAVDLHAFPRELLGATQRAVAQLFERTIYDLARVGDPVIVLLDEVETLAVDRGRVSYDTNPVDVHRATNAVLTGLDWVAQHTRNVLFVATTNNLAALDDAFLSRVDVHERIGLPTASAIQAILADSLREITGAAIDGAELSALAASCEAAGLDARQVRKLVLRAIVNGDAELALAPDGLRFADLVAAVADIEKQGGQDVGR